MEKLMNPIGVWCKRGAWVIAVVGSIGVVVEVYLFVHASGGAPWSSILVQLLPLVLSIVPTFIFYSLILYAVGVTIDRFLVHRVGDNKNAKAGGVMLDEVEETAIEPAMVDVQEIDDLRQDKAEDVIAPSTTAEVAEEESSMTQDKAEDVIAPSTTAEVAEEESNMTQDKVEDVTAPLTMVGAAEEESDVTLANEEASPIKPTTVASNGKNRDMKLARRRQRK